MIKSTKKVVVSGAAGQIAYSLLFRLGAGALYGEDQDISLCLLDVPAADDRVTGVAMELADCAFPRVRSIIATNDPVVAFEGADVIFLVGAKPRGAGEERSDLLKENAKIFETQGEALNKVAGPDVKVLVVGNPANTNALVLARHAPNVPRRNITAMMRLDHNRAVSMLAGAADASVSEVTQMVVWGNHSSTMVADVSHAQIEGKPAQAVVDPAWLEGPFRSSVAERGSEIIRARGASSAASAANAALDHMRDWIHGSDGRWVTFGIFGGETYGFDADLVMGLPVICKNGDYEIVALEISAAVRERIVSSTNELAKEREAVWT